MDQRYNAPLTLYVGSHFILVLEISTYTINKQ